MLFYEREALERVTLRLKALFPDRLIAVYAFGSRVRGDHDAWSDLDVLVIVKGKDTELQHKIIDLFTEEELKTGVPFSPIVRDVSVFENERKLNTPFYQNITREGVRI
ncbi:MAG: nucleotidyltransferase domain-containing protein [Nitrospirae bacterium]|nr:MAG: nucleotidyltransferase domain-containing protein [Nitrospirota bacterium]